MIACEYCAPKRCGVMWIRFGNTGAQPSPKSSSPASENTCGSGSASSSAGALVFPRLPELPFDPYRPALYTAEELYRGLERGYADTPDARIFAWARAQLRPGGLDADLSAALHDHAISEALHEAIDGAEHVVGVMGGHAQRRGSEP